MEKGEKNKRERERERERERDRQWNDTELLKGKNWEIGGQRKKSE